MRRRLTVPAIINDILDVLLSLFLSSQPLLSFVPLPILHARHRHESIPAGFSGFSSQGCSCRVDGIAWRKYIRYEESKHVAQTNAGSIIPPQVHSVCKIFLFPLQMYVWHVNSFVWKDVNCLLISDNFSSFVSDRFIGWGLSWNREISCFVTELSNWKVAADVCEYFSLLWMKTFLLFFLRSVCVRGYGGSFL